MSDPQTHAAHYGGADNPHEAIKVIEFYGFGFSIGNVVKYVFRAGKKPGATELDDLRKAHWYLERRIAELENE